MSAPSISLPVVFGTDRFGAIWCSLTVQLFRVRSELEFGLGLVKKHRILAQKRSATKWLRRKVVDPSASTSESAPHESDATLVAKVSVVAANTLSPNSSEACSDASSLLHDPATFSCVFTFAKVSSLFLTSRFL